MAGCGCDVRACRSELRLDNLRLDFHNPYVFVKSQWSWHPAVFVTYRVLVAVYLAGVTCFDGVYHGLSLDHRYKVLLYLPNLTFVLIAGYFVLMATVTVFYNLPGSSYTSLLRRTLPWYLKLAWLLYNTTAATSVLVTVVHWTLVRETNQQTIDFVIDVNKYILNVAFLFIELIFSGVPVRILHGIYPMVWVALYFVMLVVYWAMGGTGVNGETWVYVFIDYDNSWGLAVAYSLGAAFVAAPIAHCLWFVVYIIRSNIVCTPCSRGSARAPLAAESETTPL
ncbi:PREDICTED: protein rolling stone-like [Branchiostoma belcheri]|uniref:Protein rolling stone-like n=1 Tax=Branchiostoma belcheri TaxID=7741 RepID=A0A6P4YUS9_BRABE|nr:PREDICTED: protein rolling stone-like [Branchiostoma belcheri]